MKEKIIKNKDPLSIIPKIVELDEINVIYHREIGEYILASTKAWNKLEKIIRNQRVISFDITKSSLIGICHDDTFITEDEKIRYDACITCSQNEMKAFQSIGLDTKQIVAGKYVCATHLGDITTSESTWLKLFHWIKNNGYRFANSASFEKYINILNTQNEPTKQITEIYISIK